MLISLLWGPLRSKKRIRVVVGETMVQLQTGSDRITVSRDALARALASPSATKHRLSSGKVATITPQGDGSFKVALSRLKSLVVPKTSASALREAVV